MKRFSYVIIIFILMQICPTAWADTTWVDTGDVSGSWTSSGTPYVIRSGDVTVPTGDTLFISRGVVVLFTGPYRLLVNGVLAATGRSDDSIRFTTDTLTNPDRWRGIYAPSGVCSLRFSIVENAQAAAGLPGAGIRAETGRLYLNACSIRRNSTTGEGGGVYCGQMASAQILDSRLTGNQAGSGGGMACRDGYPIVTRCLIAGNVATERGGGILLLHSGPTIARSILLENRVVSGDGGGIAADSSFFRLLNCVLLRNRAAVLGGGLYCRADSNSVVGFCDFIADSAQTGGGIFNVHTPISVLSSIIAYTVDGSGISFATVRPATVTTSDFFANAGGDFSGEIPTGLGVLDNRNARGTVCDRFLNFRANPLFTDAANGDFHLTAASPCISAAQMSSVTIDFDGNLRPNPAGSQPDVGAFESADGGGYLFLSGRQRGTLPASDYVVGADLSVAANDTLTLLPGTTLRFLRGVTFSVYGVLQAIGTEQDSIVFTRQFDGDSLNWGGLYFIGSRDSCRLSYVTVEHVTGTGTTMPGAGGGITCVTASPTLDHCLIRYCVASSGANMGTGSGLGCYAGSHPVVAFSRIYHNGYRADHTVAVAGGGIFGRASSPQFFNCRIDSNASGAGGGVYGETSNLRLESCRIDHNNARQGGALYCWHGTPLVTSCVIDWNRADSGAVYVNASAANLIGSTLVSNSGGGIVCSGATLNMNSTIVAMSAQGSGFYFYRDSQNSTVGYCDIFDSDSGAVRYADNNPGFGPAGLSVLAATNINADSCDRYYNMPHDALFADPVHGDYHLQEFSPCINAGAPSRPRDPDGTVSDIGMFWHVAPPRPVTSFDVILPAQNDTMRVDSARFVWHATQDPDSGEVITYQLHLSSGALDTALSIQADTFRMVYPRRLGFRDSTSMNWWVTAHSLYPDSTVHSRSTRTVRFQRPFGPVTPFDLVQPLHGDTLRTDSLYFIWRQAFDSDSGEVVSYQLHLQGGTIDTLFAAQADTFRHVRLLQVGFRDSTRITWWVTAHSLYPDSTVHSLSSRVFVFQRPYSAVHGAGDPLPSQFALHENYPNPFNASTTIRFDLPRESHVKLELFDMLGRQAAVLLDEQRAGGSYRIQLDAANLPSGIYLCRMETSTFHAVRKIILLK
jgi:hypothetical protein